MASNTSHHVFQKKNKRKLKQTSALTPTGKQTQTRMQCKQANKQTNKQANKQSCEKHPRTYREHERCFGGVENAIDYV
jgi:hypothetical protein